MSVLKYGVMSAVVGGRPDRHSLLVGNFLCADDSWRIARARRRDRGVKRMSEIISQCDTGRSGFHLGSGGCVGRWIKLRGHFLALYTARVPIQFGGNEKAPGI